MKTVTLQMRIFCKCHLRVFCSVREILKPINFRISQFNSIVYLHIDTLTYMYYKFSKACRCSDVQLFIVWMYPNKKYSCFVIYTMVRHLWIIFVGYLCLYVRQCVSIWTVRHLPETILSVWPCPTTRDRVRPFSAARMVYCDTHTVRLLQTVPYPFTGYSWKTYSGLNEPESHRYTCNIKGATYWYPYTQLMRSPGTYYKLILSRKEYRSSSLLFDHHCTVMAV